MRPADVRFVPIADIAYQSSRVDIKKGPLGCEHRSDPFCDPPKVGHPGWVIRRLMLITSVRWIDLAVRLITPPDAMRLFVTPSTPS